MKKQGTFSAAIEQALDESGETALDLVVPFTNPAATRSALHAATALSHGLNAVIRLLKVQVVPFPMDRSPVELGFLTDQLKRMAGNSPVRCEVRLAREFEFGLRSGLRERSMVVLATLRRPWRTRAESLARNLRRAGHTVLLVPQEGRESNA